MNLDKKEIESIYKMMIHRINWLKDQIYKNEYEVFTKYCEIELKKCVDLEKKFEKELYK